MVADLLHRQIGTLFCLLLLLALGMFSLCACGSPPSPTPTEAPASIVVSGSTGMMPLLGELVAAFQAHHPSTAVILEPGNSYQGLEQVLDGNADLAALSVAATDEVWSAPIALGTIALVVHPGNTVTDLTLAQVHDLFAGRVWRWEDLGGEAGEIVAVSREEGSGTRLAFEALVMAFAAGLDCQPALVVAEGATQVRGCEGEAVTPMAVVMPGSEAVVEYVAAHPGAIGYVGQAYVSDQVRAVDVEGRSPRAIDGQVADYPLVQPLLLAATKEPTGPARQFVDFCLSAEGQAIVAQKHVPVR